MYTGRPHISRVSIEIVQFMSLRQQEQVLINAPLMVQSTIFNYDNFLLHTICKSLHDHESVLTGCTVVFATMTTPNYGSMNYRGQVNIFRMRSRANRILNSLR